MILNYKLKRKNLLPDVNPKSLASTGHIKCYALENPINRIVYATGTLMFCVKNSDCSFHKVTRHSYLFIYQLTLLPEGKVWLL